MWGENWGSMIWGGAATVPLTTSAGWILLGMLLGAGVVVLRRPPSKAATTTALVGVALAPLVALAVTLPHSFTNGTVADANEVNANFTALADGVSALETGLLQVGTAAPVPYAIDAERYVVEAEPADVGVVVPIDQGLISQLCQDLDGCKVTLGMLDWVVTQPGAQAFRHVQLHLSETSSWWRMENDVSDNDGNGFGGHFDVFDCILTDAEAWTGFPNGTADTQMGFGLLNVQGGSYPDETTRCRVVFED